MKRQPDTEYFSHRLTIVSITAYVLLGLLVGRVWYLQWIKGAYFRDLSENNRIRNVRTVPPRGNIYDRFDRILVQNRPAFNIALVTEDIDDVDETITRLASIVERPKEELYETLKSRGTRQPFQPKIVLPDVSRQDLARVKVNLHQLPGVTVEVVPRRKYPHGRMASQLLGYTREISREQLSSTKGKGYRPGDVIGQTGLEREWENKIRGKHGVVQVEVDARGSRRGELAIVESNAGEDLYLNIDLKLQRAVEEAFADKAGALVALDPNNGKVLALVSSPTFDSNFFSRPIASTDWKALTTDPAKPLTNRAIASIYPPGSTIKLLFAAAGLAEKKITPKTTLYCPGYYTFAGRRYHCHKRTGHGHVNIKQAITMSCNAYFYQLGQMLGIDLIHKYGELFGLGMKSRIGLSGEETGILPSEDWKIKLYGERWYPGETLSVSIGQGFLSVTPLQLAVMMSAIANGGTIYRPTLVRKVVDTVSGNVDEFSPEVVRETGVSEEVLAQVRSYAAEVVNNKRGTGSRAAIEGITVGGKTGTAQVRSLKRRGTDEEGEDHAWFVGLAPVEDPQIVFAIIVEHAGHGGVTAAPIAKRLLEVFFGKQKTVEVPVAET